MKRILLGIIGVVMVGMAFLPMNEKVYADCAGADTSILDCGDATDEGGGIGYLLNLVLSVLVYGVGVAGVFGVTIAGVMYLTARDSAEQTTKAKKRLMEVAVGMVAFAVMGGLLSWLIPGGLKLDFGIGSGSSGNSGEVSDGNNSNGGSNNGGSTGNNGNTTGNEADKATNRTQGSEEAASGNIGVGSGDEGWLEE